jgi:hypothetical protein
MKGRTEENIRKSMDKMHKIAEIMFDQELEVIPSYIEHKPPENSKAAIWYLGESIKKMAEADYFIGVGVYNTRFSGCATESFVARHYGIPMHIVSIHDLMPDIAGINDDEEF